MLQGPAGSRHDLHRPRGVQAALSPSKVHGTSAPRVLQNRVARQAAAEYTVPAPEYTGTPTLVQVPELAVEDVKVLVAEVAQHLRPAHRMGRGRGALSRNTQREAR